MSDILQHVLRMPRELRESSELTRMQFDARVIEAADRIRELEAQLEAAKLPPSPVWGESKEINQAKLKEYRDLQNEIEAMVLAAFPGGSVVRPVGCTSAAWNAFTGVVKGDRVWCEFDNGNRYFCAADEIERIR